MYLDMQTKAKVLAADAESMKDSIKAFLGDRDEGQEGRFHYTFKKGTLRISTDKNK